ncbi:hypothetical protein GBAR_LOCUS2269 [Geodia barretti]|uniref:Uncharacterized protein n=1 Tax=Geodia barretti TaxID=519541 RepID=A0AA35R0T4_GEOBA|nr:hypothetical protein GBAR_LOCUS2269 [Geodia barretti]
MRMRTNKASQEKRCRRYTGAPGPTRASYVVTKTGTFNSTSMAARRTGRCRRTSATSAGPRTSINYEQGKIATGEILREVNGGRECRNDKGNDGIAATSSVG